MKPTLVLRDGASETEVNVDALLRGEASVVEAALDDSVRFWIEYIPAPPEPRRGDVVELEPWSHHGAVVPHNNDGLDFTVDACADGLVRIAWVERPAAMSDDDTPWQCNVTLPRPAVRVARRDSWADALARPAAALRETEAGRRLAPVADDVATALAPAVAASGPAAPDPEPEPPPETKDTGDIVRDGRGVGAGVGFGVGGDDGLDVGAAVGSGVVTTNTCFARPM